MPAGVQTIGLFVQIIASNAFFAPRRLARGVDAIDDNPLYGGMNMAVAAGQVLKGCNAAKEAVALSNPESKIMTEGAGNVIKNLSKTEKVSKYVKGAVSKISNNINPFICATSAAKVLFGDEDKCDAAAKEAIALGTMFGAEKVGKLVLGMPNTIKENGKIVTQARTPLYKKSPFLEKQAAAFKDYCATKKLFNSISLKYLPQGLKGLAFAAGFSMTGYFCGNYMANKLIGTKDKKETA